MERNRLTGNIKFFCDGIYIVRTGSDHIDNCSPGRVRNSLVYIPPCLHHGKIKYKYNAQAFTCANIPAYFPRLDQIADFLDSPYELYALSKAITG